MVSTLDDTKRLSIATKLADMKVLQNLLINNEQQFIQDCADDEIRDRLQDMLKDDQKNLGILDTVIVQYGVKGEPKKTSQKMIEQVQELMEGSELTLFEKVQEHELLKHKQTMAGLLIHKAAQVVGADVEAAIAPLNTVNFENRAHQEQLKVILEILGVRELTGLQPQQGLWARVQDAVAALTGVVGSVVTRTDDEMTIRELLLMDHTKADTLFIRIYSPNSATISATSSRSKWLPSLKQLKAGCKSRWRFHSPSKITKENLAIASTFPPFKSNLATKDSCAFCHYEQSNDVEIYISA
jgi:hypothetical protein